MWPLVPSRNVGEVDCGRPLAAAEWPELRRIWNSPCAAGPIFLCVEVWWSCHCDRLGNEPGPAMFTGVRVPFWTAAARFSMPIDDDRKSEIPPASDPPSCHCVFNHWYHSRS
jgi:hypothetical protein